MTVTAPVGLQKIKTEFNGPNTFSSYVRGGSYVPNIPALSGISTTVNGLAMSTFLNASNLTVDLPTYNPGLADVVLQAYGGPAAIPSWAQAALYLFADGTGRYKTANVNTGDTEFNFNWLQSGNASDYYAWLDTPTGDQPTIYPSNPLDTSLQLNTFRGWEWYVESLPLYTGGLVTAQADTVLRIKDSGGNDLAAVSVFVLISASSSGVI